LLLPSNARHDAVIIIDNNNESDLLIMHEMMRKRSLCAILMRRNYYAGTSRKSPLMLHGYCIFHNKSLTMCHSLSVAASFLISHLHYRFLNARLSFKVMNYKCALIYQFAYNKNLNNFNIIQWSFYFQCDLFSYFVLS
jgi:hypothetical protein